MMRKSVVAIMAAIVACMAGTAAADVVCPDSSYAVVNFNAQYTGTYMNGSDYDYVTIAPNGLGETFPNAASGQAAPLADIEIRVYLKNCNGDPLVGVPAQEIVLYNSGLCICPGGNNSDAGTDINGCAEFTGSIAGGGCVQGLDVFADGVPIGYYFVNGGAKQLGSTVPVNINSTDTGLASPCFTDSSDITALAGKIGFAVPQAQYDICFDYNETGAVDSGDVTFMAGVIGAQCQ